MGVVPIWGFQMLVAIFLSYIFRLNKVIVLIFSNISIPPLLPFILFGSYYAGHLLIGGEKLIFSTEINLEQVQSVLKQYLIGSVIFALFLGFLFSISSYLFMSLSNKLISKK